MLAENSTNGDMELVPSATLKNAAENSSHTARHRNETNINDLTSNSPFATFSDRWMNCLLHKSLQIAMASGRELNLGNSLGHLVPFFGSTKKLTSFSPIGRDYENEHSNAEEDSETGHTPTPVSDR